MLTTGPLPPNPAELLGSQRMRSLLEMLTSAYDLVIIDSPPVQAVTDSAILSSFVDGTLLAIDASRGRRRAVRDAGKTLERAGANVLGAVLNRVRARNQAEYPSYYSIGDDTPTGGPSKLVEEAPGAATQSAHLPAGR